MTIDAHTHLFTENIRASYFAKAKGRIDKAIVLHYPTLLNNDISKQRPYPLEELLTFAEGKQELAVVASVSMNEELEPQLQKLESLFREGKIVGLKLYIGYQHFYPDDERVGPVAKLCAKYSRPLIFHTGDVYDPDGIALLKYARPLPIDDVASRHPETPIIIAHFGFPYLLEAATIASKNDNVYVDISGTLDDIEDATGAEKTRLIKEEKEQYVQELRRVYAFFPSLRFKTLFGTDYAGEETSLCLVDPYFELMDTVFTGTDRQSVEEGVAAKLFGFRA